LPALDAASRAAQAAAMIQTLTATPMRLLRNADVYAPAALGRRRDLLLGGGKVLWLGEVDPGDCRHRLGCRQPSIWTVARLVPDFIDGHVHVTGGGGEAGFATRVPPLPLSRTRRQGRHHGGRPARHRRRHPRHARTGRHRLRPARGRPVGLGLLRRLSPAAGHADRQRAQRHRLHRP
jgi:hypothetical protein